VAVFTGPDGISLFTWRFLARPATEVTPATPCAFPAAVGIVVKTGVVMGVMVVMNLNTACDIKSRGVTVITGSYFYTITTGRFRGHQ